MYGGDIKEDSLLAQIQHQIPPPELFCPFYVWKFDKTDALQYRFTSAVERMIVFGFKRAEIYWGCGYEGPSGNQLRHNIICVPTLKHGHFPHPLDRSFVNPFQKPRQLNRRLINMFVKPNGTIVDLMSGSASMAVEAFRTGHSCASFEVNAMMYQLGNIFL